MVSGGLWFDSLSANPLGITILPLLAIGFVIQLRRDLILRDQSFAQFVIGVAAICFICRAIRRNCLHNFSCFKINARRRTRWWL